MPTHKKIQSSSASLPTLSSGRETLEVDWLSKIVIITCGVEVNLVIKPIWKLFIVVSTALKLRGPGRLPKLLFPELCSPRKKRKDMGQPPHVKALLYFISIGSF